MKNVCSTPFSRSAIQNAAGIVGSLWLSAAMAQPLSFAVIEPDTGPSPFMAQGLAPASAVSQALNAYEPISTTSETSTAPDFADSRDPVVTVLFTNAAVELSVVAEHSPREAGPRAYGDAGSSTEGTTSKTTATAIPETHSQSAASSVDAAAAPAGSRPSAWSRFWNRVAGAATASELEAKNEEAKDSLPQVQALLQVSPEVTNVDESAGKPASETPTEGHGQTVPPFYSAGESTEKAKDESLVPPLEQTEKVEGFDEQQARDLQGASQAAAQYEPQATLRDLSDVFLMPYTPSELALVSVQVDGSWIEVYQTPAEGAQSALQLLNAQEIPPAVGLVADNTFHATSAQGETIEAGLVSYRVTRQGVEVQYDIDCLVVPAKGDVLQAEFKQGDYRIKLQGELLVHYVFGPQTLFNAEAVRLAEMNAQNCHLIQEQRLIYDGSLEVWDESTLVSKGAVVFQNLVQE